MKKVFSILFFVSIFQFPLEATNPFEELKKHTTLDRRSNLDNLNEKKKLERVERLFHGYCDRYLILSSITKVDPQKEDGIRQILKDIQQIHEKDPTANILVFLDIDQFTFWKDGFTPQVHLSKEKIDNFYWEEDHKNLFRDPEFPNVIRELKKLGCVIYGLTARYSNYTEYTETHFSRIKNDCQKLQQFIKFSSFPEDFKYTGIKNGSEDFQNFIDFGSFSQNSEYSQFFLHNLSEDKNIFTPLFGCSGIFLTRNKLKTIDYLLKNEEELGLFLSEQKPSHIIFGDDWGGNLIGEIPNNTKCYHWPYPYQIEDIFLPYVELHKNGQEAFIHLLYILGSEPKLREFILTNLRVLSKKNKEGYANWIKVILNDIIFMEKNTFLNFVGEGDSNEINAILNYLKWENDEHQMIQEYFLKTVLKGCVLQLAINMYQEGVKEFFDNLKVNNSMDLICNNIVENIVLMPQLGDSPRNSHPLEQESLPNEIINKYETFHRYIGTFLKHEIIVKNFNVKVNNFDCSIIPENKKIEMVYNIIDHFIYWYFFPKRFILPLNLELNIKNNYLAKNN